MKKEDLEILLSLSRVQVKSRHGPVGIRPSDVPLLIGDPTKFRDLTGWASRIPLEQTLRDLLEYTGASHSPSHQGTGGRASRSA